LPSFSGIRGTTYGDIFRILHAMRNAVPFFKKDEKRIKIHQQMVII